MAAHVMPKGQRAWSYSRLMDYEKCPQLYKFKVIDKLPEPGSAAMERGGDIHKKAEACLNSKKSKVPQELMRLAPEIKLLRTINAVAEDQWTFTHDFLGSTSWFGKDAWARLKIDAVAEIQFGLTSGIRELKVAGKSPGDKDKGVWIVDWKTGKFRPEASVDQLELYILGAFLLRPDAKFALASLAFTDVGQLVHSFRARDPRGLSALKKKWIQRVEPLQKDQKFKATPSDAACYWCFFAKKKGGPCKFG